MSREIKFRAWGENIKEYMSQSFDGEVEIANVTRILGDLIDQGNWVIEQYTGLKDENGKEIYEGDIVSFNCYWEEVSPEDCFEIKFEDGCFRVGDGFENEAGKYLEGYRIAGNIHQNPELLGGKDA